MNGSSTPAASSIPTVSRSPARSFTWLISMYGTDSQKRVRAASDAEGRFRFVVAKGDFEADHEEPWHTAQVVATAAGFGPGGLTPSTTKSGCEARPAQPEITLARDDVPIAGRIVDLEGRPVAGVMIRPGRILEPERGDLSAWIAASKASQDGSYETERDYLRRSSGAGVTRPLRRS